VRGFEVLERARDARAKLLAVERLPGVGSDEQLAAAFLLVFDAGRVLVAGETAGHALCATHLEASEDVPGGMVSTLEDEPWWRVIGSPLCGAWVEADGRVLRLQLRSDEDAPRFITISCEGEAVRSALAPGRTRA
jgi:hypothetical protein